MSCRCIIIRGVATHSYHDLVRYTILISQDDALSRNESERAPGLILMMLVGSDNQIKFDGIPALACLYKERLPET